MFDRDIDLISPFCVNYTYEGLLDEFYGIKIGSLQVPNSVVYPDPEVRKEKNLKEDGMHEFDLQDEAGIFAEIRNKHFNVAGGYLNNVIANI